MSKMSEVKQIIACPLCGSRQYEAVDGFQIGLSICFDCGLAYQNPCFREDILKDSYSSGPDKFVYSNREDFLSSATFTENTKKLNFLRSVTAENHKVLEIGCAEGSLVWMGQSCGIDFKGLEPSHSAINNGRKIFGELPVVQGFWEENLHKIDQADIFCHYYVLEHLFIPCEFLLKAKEIFGDFKEMIFEVPNLESFWKRDYIIDLFSYQHIAHFSPASIKNLLNICGYELLEIISETGRPAKDYGMIIRCRPAKGSSKEIINCFSETKEQINRYRAALKKNQDTVIEKVTENLKEKKGGVAIFGAGDNGQRLYGLIKERVDQRLFFIDNNKEMQQKEICGRPVYAPSVLNSEKDLAALLLASTDYSSEMKHEAMKLGVPEAKIFSIYQL